MWMLLSDYNMPNRPNTFMLMAVFGGMHSSAEEATSNTNYQDTADFDLTNVLENSWLL